jgi:hypothetical protein
MRVEGVFLKVVLAAIAVALLKLAFFPASGGVHLVQPAFAQTGLIEWKDSRRIVTAGDDGATTYVWDYDEKTKVRKYTVQKGKMSLESFSLDQ